MHDPTPQDAAAAREMLDWTLARLADRRGTLPHVTPPTPLPALPAQGIGTEGVVRLLQDAVFPTVIPADHPRYLAFVPGVPSVVIVCLPPPPRTSSPCGPSLLGCVESRPYHPGHDQAHPCS
jgi:hypothetical protein